uniref:Rho GTPase activating protein 12 n=1 Tax=Amazona collaria TaxID=241587 RepID=A0A8B9FC20_9PSIT
MADKGGKIIPGQLYIEVEYDYEYEAKDKKIVIKQGEKYILVKKTNDDWWQVKRDENSKPFYVPAQYVKEIPRKALMPPVKQASVLPNNALKLTHGLQRSTENVNKSPELSSFGKSSPVQVSCLVRDANQNLGPNNSQTLGLSLDLTQNNGKLNNELQSPKVSNQFRSISMGHFPCPEFLEIEKTSFLHEQSCDSAGEGSEKIHQDSESGDELSSSSTEQMQPTTPPSQGRPDSPVYANLQELKISQSALPPLPTSAPVQINGEWETHKDTTGRCYYYNRGSQERTWKPPRWGRDASINKGDTQSHADHEHLSSEENDHSSCYSQSDSQYGSPPKGWSEELDEHGQTLYTNDYTNEKWIKHADEQGRPYYYSADGSRSEWELPKYNASPQQQRDIIKSRSLDRRLQEPIVLTKWRHSTIVLDTNDKESSTASKASFPENETCPSPKHQATVNFLFYLLRLTLILQGQEKYGLLNVTKITENGKKVRKNWMSSWAVLQGSSLLFTKTQGSGTGWVSTGPTPHPHLNGQAEGKEKGRKKNKDQRTELLIQSDNDSFINEWYKVLNYTINNQVVESDEAVEDEIPDSPGVEKQDKEKENKDSKKLRSVKAPINIDSTDQKKTKTKLKKFLTRRPTLQAVREKGYIKDQVFGSNLTSLCQRENSTVPKFVKLCIEHVEEHGLDVDGLYRVSGNLAVIQKLRFAVNHDEKLDLNDSKWEDIHVITGALKMFFRELPEPLFTYNHFNDFVNAIKQEPRQRVHAVKDLIKQLPKPNQDTMQVLFRHLKRVVENGEKNRMTYQSVAIVFGPTLLKPEKETGNIAVHTVYQNQIVELILLELNSIFGR